MNTELQTFEFQSHQLTVITDDHGEPWFIAKEVAEILEYSDAEAMTRKLDEDEVQNLQIVGFGNRGVNVINESGLWSSVLRSTKPEAKAVKKWLTSEVLPAIRKTGSYGADGIDYQTLLDKLINVNGNCIALLEEKLARFERAVHPQHNQHKINADEIAAAVRCKAEGYGYRDIGELLGRSHNSVEHMIRRAQGRYRTVYVPVAKEPSRLSKLANFSPISASQLMDSIKMQNRLETIAGRC